MKDIKDMDKFDFALINPPFCKNLHLKVGQAVTDYVSDDGEMRQFQPARWLEDPLWKWKPNYDRVKFKDLYERLDKIDMLKIADTNSLFHMGFLYNLMIGRYKNRKTNKNIEILSEDVINIIDKLVNYCEKNNIANHVEKDKIDGWRVKCNSILTKCVGDKNKNYTKFVRSKNSVFLDGKDPMINKPWYTFFHIN